MLKADPQYTHEAPYGEVRAKSCEARVMVVRGGGDSGMCEVATEQQQW